MLTKILLTILILSAAVFTFVYATDEIGRANDGLRRVGGLALITGFLSLVAYGLTEVWL